MIIAAPVLHAIRAELERVYPDEGCGLLIGDPGEPARIVRHVPVDNDRLRDGGAAHRYLVGPDAFREVEREAAAEGLAVVGVYHSHPDVPATPSAYDLAHAWPWLRYLIVEVTHGVTGDVRAWQLADDRSRFLERAVWMQSDGGS